MSTVEFEKPDHDYAKRKLELLLRDIGLYSKGEIWRELSRIAYGATGIPHAQELKAQNDKLIDVIKVYADETNWSGHRRNAFISDDGYEEAQDVLYSE